MLLQENNYATLMSSQVFRRHSCCLLFKESEHWEKLFMNEWSVAWGEQEWRERCSGLMSASLCVCARNSGFKVKHHPVPSDDCTVSPRQHPIRFLCACTQAEASDTTNDGSYFQCSCSSNAVSASQASLLHLMSYLNAWKAKLQQK